MFTLQLWINLIGMRYTFLFILSLLCILPVSTWGQYDYTKEQSKTKSAVKKLSGSLEKSSSDDEIAADYMTLAKGLTAENEYAKAENYYAQAILLYTKTKDKQSLNTAYRELAKVQEAQQKFEQAIRSYTLAAENALAKEVQAVNENDANRLKNRDNPVSQSSYIQKNIELSNTIRNKDEAVNAYQQMASVRKEMNDKEGAIVDLKSALSNVQEPEEAMKIQQEIAKTYADDEQYDEAIRMGEFLVEEAKQTNDPRIEIGQLLSLADTYDEAGNSEKSREALQEAYQLAIDNRQTMEARKILLRLVAALRDGKHTTTALNLYAGFVNQLDTLIQSDSTLIDAKFFQVHEQRITQLERERALKDDLIAKTNLFNYVLLGSICLILVFLVLIVRSLYAINKKNKRIALQSLRREMNPHFIFNSLNSINQFIAQNNELEANRYLSSYSRLMRNMMENSNKDFISLSTEAELLREYMELEYMRFRDKFTYRIEVAEEIDMDATYIPNMLIQPQLENAIWHGLRYKDGGGILLLHIYKELNHLYAVVEDNGIGLKQSRELKTKHQKHHHSRGLTNTQERIGLLNEIYHIDIRMEIQEKEGADTGVRVVLRFPFIDKRPQADEYTTKDQKRHR